MREKKPREKVYVIECRDEAGRLDFTGLQPENVFTSSVSGGITEDVMAKMVYHHAPEAALTGMNIPKWPAFIDPRWSARLKTW